MSVFKCKMCGGTIEFNDGDSVGVCDSCGTRQTLPRLDDDRRANLYDRANHFRRNNEYDKAIGLYEQILNEDQTDAEAYWSLVLCRYGIEYVEDPASHKRVPTVNRAQFTSIFDDEDYKSALRYADGYQKEIYEEEAAAINEIEKGILSISQKEQPFDVFICYKETDASGRRTQDSVLANDLYHQLTNEGFKVFFSRITLEDKLGTAYEPYIFAALNSAKVMVVLGTRQEYFNAIWVKNEWSRYLTLVKQSGGRKILIPAYRDMDPYDLPEEFSHLQAQDMSKLGFMQDLIRGIKKITGEEEPKTMGEEKVIASSAANMEPLLKRAFMFLEDLDFARADEFCEQVLNQDPENAQAYLGKLMVELKIRKQEEFYNCKRTFDNPRGYHNYYRSIMRSRNYQRIMRFGDEKIVRMITGYIDKIKGTLEGFYNSAVSMMQSASTESAFETAAKEFDSIKGYKDAEELARQCKENASDCHWDEIYDDAKAQMNRNTIDGYKKAIEAFKLIIDRKDASAQIDICQNKIEEIEEIEEIEKKYQSAVAKLQECNDLKTASELSLVFEEMGDYKDAPKICEKLYEKIIEYSAKEEKLVKIIGIILTSIIAVALILTQVVVPYVKNSVAYNSAIELYKDGKYEEAKTAFKALDDFKDSKKQIKNCTKVIKEGKYNAAAALFKVGKYKEAKVAFEALDGFKDSEAQIKKCETGMLDEKYNAAVDLYKEGKYEEAIAAFIAMDGYRDSETQIDEIKQEYYSKLLSDASPGSTVYFGSYEQDNNSSNGKEDIEWLVLAREENRILVTSKYGLEVKPYNDKYENVTWETCTLRKWMNSSFLNEAFSEKERIRIIMTKVTSDNNPQFDTYPGNDTEDKVFLMSMSEVVKYFSSNDARECKPTLYAIVQGVFENTGNGVWWLRSPVTRSSIVASVDSLGEVGEGGNYVNDGNVLVRPALWINP